LSVLGTTCTDPRRQADALEDKDKIRYPVKVKLTPRR
jgi:hypothetical protein